MRKSLKHNFKAVVEEYKTFLGEWGLIFTFFVLVVTLSNFTYKVFGFKLIPFFKTAFDSFHAWFHFLMQLLVFSWLTYTIEWMWYGLTWFCSLLLSIIPWRPHIIIPSLVTDIALLSVAFTRVFHSADLIVPREVRAAAEKRTTPQMEGDIYRAEGRFWGPIHRFLHHKNANIWHLIDFVQRIVTRPIRKYPILCSLVRGALMSIASSIFMWGFLRLSGYLINVFAAGHLTSPIMIMRKRVLKYFGLSLISAIIATGVFYVLNGWAAEWLEP